MNSKLIVVASLSAAVGAVVSWAVTADRYEAQIKMVDAEWETIQRATEDRLYEAEVLLTELKDLTPVIAGEVDEWEEKLEVVPPGETEEETREKLQSKVQEIIAGYVEGKDDESEDAFVPQVRRKIPENSAPPVVISQNSYAGYDEADEGISYSKIAVTWHPREKVLIDDESQEPLDVQSHVGVGNLNRFGDESNNPDALYVRNHRLETDFEVFRDTENPIPPHVAFGMSREQYLAAKASGAPLDVSEG